jgi:hypothetical protein
MMGEKDDRDEALDHFAQMFQGGGKGAPNIHITLGWVYTASMAALMIASKNNKEYVIDLFENYKRSILKQISDDINVHEKAKQDLGPLGEMLSGMGKDSEAVKNQSIKQLRAMEEQIREMFDVLDQSGEAS